jgi:hypothetical protein
MPFKKGQSGNLNGRPKRTQNTIRLREILEPHRQEAADKLIHLMRYGSEALQFTASREIIYLLDGKPMQLQTHRFEGDMPSVFTSEEHDLSGLETPAWTAIQSDQEH